MKKPKVSGRKEIIKIRAEINEKEPKETITKINTSKSWEKEQKHPQSQQKEGDHKNQSRNK